MIDKLFCIVLCFTVAATANAQEKCSPWDPRCSKPKVINGFYGGISIGYTSLVGQLNRTLNVNTSDRITSVGENGIPLGAFVGYQNIIDERFYLAGEGFYQYANVLIEKDENTFPGFVNYFTYIKNEYKSGIVGKFGFVHNNNIFYAKTGLAISRFILGFKDNTGNPIITSSTSKTQKGVILGGGVDFFLNKNVSVGIDYDITTYPSMGFKSNTVGSFSFKPVSHTFQTRFKYTF